MGASLAGYVRPGEVARANSSVPTRVMSAWKASASRSNCSLMCSSKVCGTPTGTVMSRRRHGRRLHRDLQPALDLANVLRVVVDAARGRRSSTSLRRRVRLPVSESRMLPSRLRSLGRAALPCCRLRTCARTPPAGFNSIGSGVGRRGPGDGVGVGAAVALAAVARIRARILDRRAAWTASGSRGRSSARSSDRSSFPT